jgi:hypothetical protein
MIVKKLPSSTIEIDLTGPQGNAFYLLGSAKNLAKQLGYSTEEIESLLEEMKAGDYQNLIEVFDEHFGTIVTLYIDKK